MRRLGEILLERGYASVGELHTGLEASHRHKGRLGTQLLRLGFVTEKQLLEALAEQTGCPPLPREVLRSTAAEVRRLMSPADARRLQAVPFAIHQHHLQVAMTNPTDRAALEEIRKMTGMPVEAFVSTEASIAAAINALVSEMMVQKTKEKLDTPTESTIRSTSEEWKGFWEGRMPSGSQLLQPLEDWPEISGTSIRYASYPALAPIVDPALARGPGYLEEDEYERALLEATSRDEVGAALLGFAARYLSRLCLFSVYKDQVHGWLAHGMGPVLEDVQCFSMDLKKASIFSVVKQTGNHYQAALPPGENNKSIAACLGEAEPDDVLLVPVMVKGRSVVFLLGDIPGQSTVSVPLVDLKAAAAAAGIALEMMIQKRKISRCLQKN